MRICGFFEQRIERRLKKGNEEEDCVDSFVGKPHEYVVRARILWFEYANTARKLRIVRRKVFLYVLKIGDTNKIRISTNARGKYHRDLLSALRSDNQPSVPHPRLHSPIRWADWLSRLRPWGGQTRLTGCHGDLMD